MNRCILYIDHAFKSLETFYHQYHPKSLWYMSIAILSITHFFAVEGFRPISMFGYLFLSLHALKYLDPPITPHNNLCEGTRLILNCYQRIVNVHQYLLSLKIQNNDIYWLLIFLITTYPIMIFKIFSSFSECYLTVIIICLLLQLKYQFEWTDKNGSSL